MPGPSNPTAAAFKGGVDIDALPDASSEQASLDPAFQAARQSLAPEKWVRTEAVQWAVNFFNPDHREWCHAEAISTDERARGNDEDVKFPDLEDSHKYITSMVNCWATHWTIGIINLHDRTIELYDPLHKEDYLRATRRALLRLARSVPEARNRNDAPRRDWTCINCIGPRQKDGFNCGILAAVFAIRRMHGMDVEMAVPADLYRKIFDFILATAHPSSIAKEAPEPALLPVDAAVEAKVQGLLGQKYPDVRFAELKAAYKYLSEGSRKVEEDKNECSRIGSMLITVRDNRLQWQRDMECYRQQILRAMRRLGQNRETYQTYARSIPKLTSLKSLKILSSLLEDLMVAYEGKGQLLEERKGEVQRNGKVVALAEIDDWANVPAPSEGCTT